jgi:hypothetical protein
MFFMTPATATAAETDEGPTATGEVTGSEMMQLDTTYEELKGEVIASGLAHETNPDGSTTFYYEDVSFTLGEAPEGPAVSPYASAGTVDGGGLYLELDNGDQRLVKNGAFAGLQALICAMGPAGAAACPFLAANFLIGQSYLEDNGICEGDSPLRIEIDLNGVIDKIGCV